MLTEYNKAGTKASETLSFQWHALQVTGIHVWAVVVSLRSMKLASAATLG